MKAAVFHGKDSGLKFEDIPVPKIGDDQILVKGSRGVQLDLVVDSFKSADNYAESQREN